MSKLPSLVQLALVIGFFALLVLIVLNPTAGLSISSFLLTMKTLFGKDNTPTLTLEHIRREQRGWSTC